MGFEFALPRLTSIGATASVDARASNERVLDHTSMEVNVCVPIHVDADIVVARKQGRALAARLRFSSSDLTVIATAISEIARNIVTYATNGEVRMTLVEDGRRLGVRIVAITFQPFAWKWRAVSSP